MAQRAPQAGVPRNRSIVPYVPPEKPAVARANPFQKILSRLKGHKMGPLGGLLAGSVISAAAFPILERLMYGSREQQMREQYELQAKLEQEQMARAGGMGNMGGMGGMAGLAEAADEPSMYSLKEGEKDSLADLVYANKRNRALRSINRSASSDELSGLLAGQEARIRSLQSPRQLTPYEIMDIIGG